MGQKWNNKENQKILWIAWKWKHNILKFMISNQALVRGRLIVSKCSYYKKKKGL